MITREAFWRAPGGGLHLSLFDDAMISMSYARTLAQTGELVWFAGAPRTEGMTNIGWTLVMALLHKVGLSGDAVVLAVIVLGLLAVWMTAFRAATTVALVAGATDRGTRFLTVLAVATCFPLLWWTMRGMEVGVLTLLTFVALNAVLHVVGGGAESRRQVVVLALVLAAGIVVRTDFMVVAGSIFLWLTLRRPSRAHLRTAAVVAVATGLTMGLCVAFRLLYYGDPVPNTYYLKLTGVALSSRFERGVLATGLSFTGYLAAPVVIIAFGWRRLTAPGRDAARLVGLVAAMGAAYTIFVGGDAWEYFLIPDRYLTPSLVLLLVLMVGVLRASPVPPGGEAVGGRRSARILAGVAMLAAAGPTVSYAIATNFPRVDLAIMALPDQTVWFALAVPVLGAASLFAWAQLRPRAGHRDARDPGSARTLIVFIALLAVSGAVASACLAFTGLDRGSRYGVLGQQIASITEPDAVVALVAAGAAQYVSDRPAVDLLGKSDERIAGSLPVSSAFHPGHDKFDLDYSVGRLQPDLIAHGWHALTPEDLVGWGYLPYRLAGDGFGPSATAICDGRRVMWVRTDSTRIRWARLLAVDPARCD